MMTIGQLSKQSGVHIETIRFYERAGVLPRAERGANNRRLYGETDAGRLSFIRQARELGFELKSVQELLAMQEQPNNSREAVSRLAANQLVAVQSRLERLTNLRDELERMVTACSNGRVADCRIIETLCKPS